MRLAAVLFALLPAVGPALVAAVPALTAAVPALAALPAPSPEERAVAAVFERARSALEAKDGASVVALLSRDTVRRLDAVRAAARSTSNAQLNGLEPAERFAALGLRRALTPADLRRKSLADLADHALAKNWLGPNLIGRAALGPVQVRGDRATALVLVNNRPSLVQADFVREDETWKIDLHNMMKLGSTMLQTIAALGGKSESALVDELLRKLPGKPALAETR